MKTRNHIAIASSILAVLLCVHCLVKTKPFYSVGGDQKAVVEYPENEPHIRLVVELRLDTNGYWTPDIEQWDARRTNLLHQVWWFPTNIDLASLELVYSTNAP